MYDPNYFIYQIYIPSFFGDSFVTPNNDVVCI